MKNKLFSPARKEAGFTLIELLTVIVIIGILAAIAIPVFTSQRARAQDAQTISDVRNIAVQAETIMSDPTKTYDDVTKANIDFASSKNVSWNISGKASLGGYCIVAKNTAGKKYTTDATVLTYDSLAGGVGQTGKACDQTVNPVVPSGSTAGGTSGVGSDIAYAASTFNATSTGSTGSRQTYTVTDAGVYKVETWGAQGGSGYDSAKNIGAGGKGAYAAGTFTLTSGQLLTVVVGQAGTGSTSASNGYSAGGGGATGVSSNATLLVVAGGGGGTTGTAYTGAAGSTTTSSNTTGATHNAVNNNGDGGASGYCSGSGAGLNANGGTDGIANSGGKNYTNGGAGGQGWTGTNSNSYGGYGYLGGGAGAPGSNWGSGGGGGYSGGVGSCGFGANSGSAGAGGGSYVASNSTTTAILNNTDKANTGNGKVVITRIS